MKGAKNMEQGTINGCFKIQKHDDDKRIAFGWAYQCVTKTGEQCVDHSGDIVDIADMEKAAYRFVKFYREGSDNHKRGGIGTMIESMMFTKEKAAALGIPDGMMPEGWWVGFEVTDEDVWKKIKSGVYKMFSIEGTASRVEI